MDKRGSIATRRSPGTFRCLPCKRTVTGTESGHCPNCGFVPPSAPDIPAPAPPVSLVLVTLVIAVVVAVLVFVTN